MALAIVRFTQQAQTCWGIQDQDQIRILDINADSTADLIQIGYAQLSALAEQSTITVNAQDVSLLSPITEQAKVLCQGANYRQHMIDSGMDPDAKAFNMFFTKSAASIHTPTGQIVKPKHVQLLDYEIELALVLGKNTHDAVQVTAENLHEYVAGICIANDVSARDVQIPQMQFFKGKSYRTFCPLGPVFLLLDRDEMHYLHQLNLTLTVNNEVRQQDNTANLVFKPAETLTEFSSVCNFAVGDVILTGTPSGCALGLPPAAVVRFTGLLPDNLKWKLFLKSQAKRRQYLQHGDVVESHIKSTDGKINLGRQHHVIS